MMKESVSTASRALQSLLPTSNSRITSCGDALCPSRTCLSALHQDPLNSRQGPFPSMPHVCPGQFTSMDHLQTCLWMRFKNVWQHTLRTLFEAVMQIEQIDCLGCLSSPWSIHIISMWTACWGSFMFSCPAARLMVSEHLNLSTGWQHFAS